MTAAPGMIATDLDINDVAIIDGFVSNSICRRMLLEISPSAWKASQVELHAAVPQASQSPAAGRSSSTIVLQQPTPWMAAALQRIEQSLHTAFNIELANLEPWQVTRYKRGQSYDYHLDCGCWREHVSGERRRTILIYLEQPVRGGATDFRALHRRIPPVAGRLLVWNNLFANGKCNYAMIHSGRPVWQGRKTILTTWEREHRFVR